MGALTPEFMFDFESEMDRITEFEFLRLSASENAWWNKIARVRNTSKRRDIIAWLLSSAQIYDAGKDGGNVRFDDMAATYQEYDVVHGAAALKMTKDKILDNDGNGFDFAAEWSANMGALMAYWPQQKISQLILNSAVPATKAYDGVQFFADNIVNSGNGHPVNQFKTGAGKYFNWMHGTASGTYPGALPIDESVPLETALKNLQIMIAYVASIKMPNGVTPRYLKPRRLLVPPRLVARAQQLTNARYIPQSTAGGGGGSGDVEAVINNWGFLEPVEIQEFAGVTPADGAAPDLTWYLACEQMSSTQLGSFVYVDREPFRITYFTGAGGGTGVDAILDRANELEWHAQGRNVAGTGHPYGIYRIDPS